MSALILSNGNDTNGGNARFSAAAKKHGRDKKVVSAFAIGNADPAGVVARFQAAADKYGGLRIRSAHRANPYMDFPHDLVWGSDDDELIRQLAREADVIHLNNSTIALRTLGVREIKHKPLLLHHHGSMLRNNPDKMVGEGKRRRAVQAVSTLDLTRFAPKDLHWLPAPYDIKALRLMKRPKDDERIRIVHAPTNRALKHTDLFLQAASKLKNVEVVLLEGKTNAEVLQAKAQADIVFDQLAFGYGCNSIEAWGMGVPVISGADDWTLHRMADEFGGQIPFVIATERTLGSVLRDLVESPQMRAEAGKIGYQHVLKYHDEKPALTRLAELYAMAIRGADTVNVPPATFLNATPREIRAFGETITPGLNVVTDPDVIARLRYLSTRPVFGIEEVA